MGKPLEICQLNHGHIRLALLCCLGNSNSYRYMDSNFSFSC